MKYDLSRLFYDYIQDEESREFRNAFWAQKGNAEVEERIEPLLADLDTADLVSDYAGCAEEFGFLTGFQLAVNLLSGGLGARAPKVEVQA